MFLSRFNVVEGENPTMNFGKTFPDSSETSALGCFETRQLDAVAAA